MKKIKLGGFSKVVPHNEKTVRKYYSFHDDGCGINHQIIREIYTLKKIKSPFVISLLNVDVDFKYIELPMYSTDLQEFINKNVLNTFQIQKIFFQICSGIHALHSSRIIHRDIKPENICLSRDSYQDDIRVVLIDAGFSRKTNDKMTPVAGTVVYQAPEMLAGAKYSYEIDIWGAGCVLGTMYLRTRLFSKGLSELELLDSQVKLCGSPSTSSIEKLGFKFLEWIPVRKGKLDKRFRHYGEELYQLITKMLHIDPRQRYKITQCLNSPYFKNNKFVETGEIVDKIYPVAKNRKKWRKILTEWMQDICSEKETDVYTTAVKMLDEFTFKTKRDIDKKNYQLIGMACMLIASKLESMTFFDVDRLAYLGYAKKKDLLEMEKIVLRDCEFD